jgi:ribonuclease PH
MRSDGREPHELRKVEIIPGYITYPEGSVLITMGHTRVICNVTVEESIPSWMRIQNLPGGWVTAEYALLPRATQVRTPRETRGLGGRTQEVKRMIGRSLRAAVDLLKLGPRTIIVDCDVIQADGGTRTAAITGGYVALAIALRKLHQGGLIPEDALSAQVAAVSVGMIAGQSLLDLCYQEDVRADVDANIAMNSRGEFIEVQATAERNTYSRQKLDEMLDLAGGGIARLMKFQENAIDASLPP